MTKKESGADAQADSLREDFLSAADPSLGNSGLAFETAAAAGDCLLRIKTEIMALGLNWTDWLDKLPFSRRTAYDYMDCAKRKAREPRKEFKSMRDALGTSSAGKPRKVGTSKAEDRRLLMRAHKILASSVDKDRCIEAMLYAFNGKKKPPASLEPFVSEWAVLGI